LHGDMTAAGMHMSCVRRCMDADMAHVWASRPGFCRTLIWLSMRKE
jgi:hypothetical protein